MSHVAAHFIELLIIAHSQVFISTFILTRVKITVAFYSILRVNYFEETCHYHTNHSDTE